MTPGLCRLDRVARVVKIRRPRSICFSSTRKVNVFANMRTRLANIRPHDQSHPALCDTRVSSDQGLESTKGPFRPDPD
jgi:hypothetical protein